MISLFFVRIFTVEQRASSNYLYKFWKQVFAYRNDGEYTIDNLAAERAIRPQTIQRKGSLF
ncbi:transposase [Segatella hominis]|nr:transposase [Segatella hominis]WOZ81432.1 transposase [Segatella hominis]